MNLNPWSLTGAPLTPKPASVDPIDIEHRAALDAYEAAGVAFSAATDRLLNARHACEHRYEKVPA